MGWRCWRSCVGEGVAVDPRALFVLLLVVPMLWFWALDGLFYLVSVALRRSGGSW